MKENMKRENIIWSDDELRASVDAYLYMLQLEISLVPFSSTEYSKLLRAGPLRNRNEASIRYRLRNISHVMEERGAPMLRSFSPAPQVGRNVKKKINELLDERQMPQKMTQEAVAPNEAPATLAEVMASLDELQKKLADFEPHHLAGFGHNNPPGMFAITPEDISEARKAAAALKMRFP